MDEGCGIRALWRSEKDLCCWFGRQVHEGFSDARGLFCEGVPESTIRATSLAWGTAMGSFSFVLCASCAVLGGTAGLVAAGLHGFASVFSCSPDLAPAKVATVRLGAPFGGFVKDNEGKKALFVVKSINYRRGTAEVVPFDPRGKSLVVTFRETITAIQNSTETLGSLPFPALNLVCQFHMGFSLVDGGFLELTDDVRLVPEAPEFFGDRGAKWIVSLPAESQLHAFFAYFNFARGEENAETEPATQYIEKVLRRSQDYNEHFFADIRLPSAQMRPDQLRDILYMSFAKGFKYEALSKTRRGKLEEGYFVKWIRSIEPRIFDTTEKRRQELRRIFIDWQIKKGCDIPSGAEFPCCALGYSIPEPLEPRAAARAHPDVKTNNVISRYGSLGNAFSRLACEAWKLYADAQKIRPSESVYEEGSVMRAVSALLELRNEGSHMYLYILETIVSGKLTNAPLRQLLFELIAGLARRIENMEDNLDLQPAEREGVIRFESKVRERMAFAVGDCGLSVNNQARMIRQLLQFDMERIRALGNSMGRLGIWRAVEGVDPEFKTSVSGLPFSREIIFNNNSCQCCRRDVERFDDCGQCCARTLCCIPACCCGTAGYILEGISLTCAKFCNGAQHGARNYSSVVGKPIHAKASKCAVTAERALSRALWPAEPLGFLCLRGVFSVFRCPAAAICAALGFFFPDRLLRAGQHPEKRVAVSLAFPAFRGQAALQGLRFDGYRLFDGGLRITSMRRRFLCCCLRGMGFAGGRRHGGHRRAHRRPEDLFARDSRVR